MPQYAPRACFVTALRPQEHVPQDPGDFAFSFIHQVSVVGEVLVPGPNPYCTTVTRNWIGSSAPTAGASTWVIASVAWRMVADVPEVWVQA